MADMPSGRLSALTAKHTLLRSTLGIGFGVAVAVGSMIGAGILRSPADVATQLPVPALFLGAWVVGGLYALLGANALAELGTMLPCSGGQYVFVRHALGPYAGFLVGWNDWMSTCGSTAAVALVAGEALGTLVPRLSSQAVVIASVLIALTTVVLYRGVRESDRTQQLTSALKAAALLALVIACLLARATGAVAMPASTVPRIATPAGIALAAAFITALQGIIYAYDGWTGVLYFSEEVRDVGREIPRSLFLGVVSVILLYLLLNIAFLAVLPLPVLAASPLAAASAATAVFGPRGGTLVQGLVVIALPSAIVANTLMASRVLFALGRDKAAPGWLSTVNAGGTPGAALLASSIVAGAFVLSGAFEKVITICAFLFVASYSISFASVFVLRRREPHAPRPYRAWGHPWTTGVVLAGSIVFLGGTVIADPRNGLIALGLVAVSYPVYRMFLKR
ncbi:MAG: amino acid permease-associated region [Gemmatimonadetes bacterium]|nr:amino acid permease-associated region [Gemmatimonadota bacterium]